jgi:ferrochelatase
MTVRGALTPDASRFDDIARTYDAVLVMSFGGPEGPADVMPFLVRVTQGRNIPRERLLEVAHHYEQFGGVSPINAQNRALIKALEAELKANGPALPVYFGNRNWHPFVTDTVRTMRDAGVRRAIAFVTSGFSTYSGCRQYREDIIRALDAVPGAPEIDKIRVFFNHPGFIAPSVANLEAALAQVPAARRAAARVAFTAHSIPMTMAKGSAYEVQLAEAARLVAEGAGRKAWDLVYQSRSGAPHMPWLGPDVLDYLKEAAGGARTCARAAGLHLRPHGSAVRPGHRGEGNRGGAGDAPSAGCDGGDGPGVRADDPRSDRRADDGAARTRGAGDDGGVAGCVSGGLLPGRAAGRALGVA